jgi:hypothetical protein
MYISHVVDFLTCAQKITQDLCAEKLFQGKERRKESLLTRAIKSCTDMNALPVQSHVYAKLPHMSLPQHNSPRNFRCLHYPAFLCSPPCNVTSSSRHMIQYTVKKKTTILITHGSQNVTHIGPCNRTSLNVQSFPSQARSLYSR